MPHTYTHTIRVRFDECDVYGHLNNAMYLRYMQEAAFVASADAGLDGAAFEQMGRLWLIRGHDIHYLEPLRAGDQVDIRTWNVGYRRTLMRRAYEMRNAASGAVVAKAHTDWVFLDRESLRPTTIPPDVVSVYLSSEEAANTLPKPSFPKPKATPPGTFRVQKRIEWRDLDMMHHLNNAVYPSYAEDVAMQLGDHFGWSFKEWLEDGLAVVTHRTRIQYRQPATFEDTIEIATWLYDVRRTSAMRYYAFHRLTDGELLAQMEMLWALINVNTGRPTRLPERFQQVLKSNISPSQAD
jgi:acyl-CoA thioester hydrolase